MLRNMLTPEHRTATQLELEFEKRVCQPVKRAIKMARCQIQQVQEAIDSISTQNGLVLQAPEILVVQMLDKGKSMRSDATPCATQSLTPGGSLRKATLGYVFAKL